MKKFIRRIVSLSLILTLLTGSTVFAGVSMPSSTINLATHGSYNFSGKAKTSNLYSNYYFTGKDTFTICVINQRNASLKVKVYEKGSAFAADSFSVPAYGELKYKSTGRSSKKNYYLVFYAKCEFYGYIM